MKCEIEQHSRTHSKLTNGVLGTCECQKALQLLATQVCEQRHEIETTKGIATALSSKVKQVMVEVDILKLDFSNQQLHSGCAGMKSETSAQQRAIVTGLDTTCRDLLSEEKQQHEEKFQALQSALELSQSDIQCLKDSARINAEKLREAKDMVSKRFQTERCEIMSKLDVMRTCLQKSATEALQRTEKLVLNLLEDAVEEFRVKFEQGLMMNFQRDLMVIEDDPPHCGTGLVRGGGDYADFDALRMEVEVIRNDVSKVMKASKACEQVNTESILQFNAEIKDQQKRFLEDMRNECSVIKNDLQQIVNKTLYNQLRSHSDTSTTRNDGPICSALLPQFRIEFL